MKPLVTSLIVLAMLSACSKEALDTEVMPQNIENIASELDTQQEDHLTLPDDAFSKTTKDQERALERFGVQFFPAQLHWYARFVDSKSSNSTQYLVLAYGTVNIEGEDYRVVIEIALTPLGQYRSGKILLAGNYGRKEYVIRTPGEFFPKMMNNIQGHLVSYDSAAEDWISRLIVVQVTEEPFFDNVVDLWQSDGQILNTNIGLILPEAQ